MKKIAMFSAALVFVSVSAFAQVVTILPITTATPLDPNKTYSIAWDQDGATQALAQSFQYTVYVDGIGSVVAHICGSNFIGGVQCAAPLPALTGGNHTIEVSAADLSVPTSPLSSEKSTALPVRVVVVPRTPTNPRLELK